MSKKPTTQDEPQQAFPTFQAPPDTSITWNDTHGTHETATGPDGLFTPIDAGELEAAQLQGWPVLVDAAPAPGQDTATAATEEPTA